MKLLVDARSLGSHPSGIGMYLYDFLIELLKEPDFEITLLSDIATSDEMLDLAERGVPIVTYGTQISQSVQVLKYFRFVQDSLDYYHPDLFWEPNNLIPVRLKRFSGKILVTIHDVFPLTQPENHGHIYPIYFKYGLKQTMKQADGLTYNSMETKRDVEQRFAKATTLPNLISYIIIKNPVNEDTLPSPTVLFPDIPILNEDYFLYIGNLEKRKGTDLLLKAYQLYRKSGGTKICISVARSGRPTFRSSMMRSARRLRDLFPWDMSMRNRNPFSLNIAPAFFSHPEQRVSVFRSSKPCIITSRFWQAACLFLKKSQAMPSLIMTAVVRIRSRLKNYPRPCSESLRQTASNMHRSAADICRNA